MIFIDHNCCITPVLQNKKYILFWLLAVGLLTSCNYQKNSEEKPQQLYSKPKVVALNNKAGYKVNQLTGDSIQLKTDGLGNQAKTGVPYEVTGEIINLANMTPPLINQAGKPVSVAYSSNVKVVPEILSILPLDSGQLKILDCTELHSDFVLTDMYGDTIPTGKPIQISGTKTPVKTPPAIKALPPGSKGDVIYNFKYLNLEQGLPASSINDMLMDQNNRLWIGTFGSGLCSYDGQSLRHYTVREGFKCQFIQDILEDKKGNIWIASNDGLFKYDGEYFISYIENFNGINAVVEDKNGSIWVGFWSGIIKINPQEDSDGNLSITYYTVNEGLSINGVNSAYVDRTGNLWFGTWSGGVNKFDGHFFTHFTTDIGLSSNSVNDIYEDEKGIYWFGTSNGLNRFDGNSFTNFTEREGLSGSNIRTITEDQNNNLLVGTSSGVNILRTNSSAELRTITQITGDEGLSGSTANVLLLDKTKNLWIGTAEAGISRLKMGAARNKYATITNLFEEQGLINNNVTSVSEDHSGNLWFGTRNGLSHYIPGDNVSGKGIFYNYNFDQGLPINVITSTLYDSQGNLWLGSNGQGFSKYDGNTFIQYNSSQGLIGGNVMAIEEDRKGNHWFATYSGVSRFDGLSFTNFNMNDGLPNASALTLYKDKAGDMWIGTFTGGVVKYHLPEKPDLKDETFPANGYFTIYTDKDGLSHNTVISIHQDKYGNMWFGTMEGLNRFDGESFTYFTKDEGLSGNIIMSIADDDKGNLLIGTERGLDYLEIYPGKTHNNEIATGWPADSFRIKKLSQVAGLKTTGFNLNSSLVDTKSRVWMGTANGLITFDENVSYFNSNPPEVFLTGLDIDGQFTDFRRLSNELRNKIKFSEVAAFTNYPNHLELPYNLNHLTFHYVGIDWSAPENIKYSYKIEGLNEEWSVPSADIKADYRNIGFGKYKFMVRAIGESSEWSDPFTFEFTVRPPIWFSIWAYIFYALCLAIGIFIFDRFQRRRLIEKERQKTRDRELEQAHEIEKAYTELKSTQAQLIQSEKMASLGELTAGIAHEIQNPLNFVNNFSEVNSELLDDLKEAIANNDQTEIEVILNDLKENESKVTSHGKRAESIVKGMLLHSRGSNGQKESTDINALCDEYLRLSYHGFRAKDKSFSADFKFKADEKLPKINVVPQDIGRVLLNLINNAFYVVNEKAKSPPTAQGGTSENLKEYKPQVIVNTSVKPPLGGMGGQIEITVSDNGPGIPNKVKEKIFQPFFTTKPTGEGTGLGLSLSYDIIKAHGGELKVESHGGEGTTFHVHLPIN